jgi:hypothetical protein
MGGTTSSMPKALIFSGEKPLKKKDDEYFEPTYKVAWLIGNEKYDKIVFNGK